jgi:iron complex outermembrane receptor protein
MYLKPIKQFQSRDMRQLLRVTATVMLLCLVSVLHANAQNTVKGTVVDPQDEPLIGATVLVVGQTTGTATDIDGNFTINAPQGATLRISYVGYESVDVKVKGNNLRIVLKENNELLDEVVVVGYGTMKRKDLTGSITTVNSKDLNVGSYTDPGQLLQGKVPGLVVVQNSDPNGGVNSITLRGASTLNGSTDPLYVVDGIPGVNLNLIPPADIESIDVLRDASATAIYGSKAANGVIIVTTKKGAEGPARVTYQGYVSWEGIANDHKMMTADQLRAYAADNGITINNDHGYDTNWQKEVQRTGFAHNHNISISGGGKSTTYNASINYIERDGIIKGVGNNLFTARAYVETKALKDRLLIGAGINGNVRKEWGVQRGGDGKSVYNAMYYYSPLVPVTNEDGSWYSDMTISQNYNPLTMINEDYSQSILKRMQVTGKLQFKIIDGLFLNGNFSYENDSRDYKDYNSHASEINNRNGETSREASSSVNKLMEIFANFDREFKELHKVSVMAGYSWEQSDADEGFGARGYNFYDDAIGWNNFGMANSWDTDPVWSYSNNIGYKQKRMISFYGRVNYSFDSKYIIQAAVRRDGASTFGSNNKWATFPSASAAWRISGEKFMERTADWLTDLKLRVGWGMSGNSSGYNIYTSRFYYTTGARFDYVDPETGEVTSYKNLNAARNANDNLKWETTTMLNLGIDFAFLGGRINGTIEYYNKDTKDMIWDYPVSTTRYPVNWITANVGRMRNRGVEVTINAVPIQGPFTWSTSLNLSHNQNKVISVSDPAAGFNAGILNRYNPNLPGASTATTQRILEGYPIGTFYMPEWAGYDEYGNSVFYTYNKNNEDVSGERAVDENGNYILTNTPEEKDRVIVGSAQPKLTMGWNNNFTWKNWDLNLFFTGVFGQKIFNEPRAYFGYVSNVAMGKNVLADIAEYQNPADGYSAYPSDRWLENGSYFKLATITLGYTFKGCFNGWLDSVRLYVSGNNVFTITGYKGRDPEICLGGLEPGHDTRSDHYPRTRQILVGATVNF